MPYQVQITDTKTGESRMASYPTLSWEKHSLFWWTDGNFGCDCNRGDAFARAKEEPDLDLECCGENRFRVDFALLPDGTKIQIDS